MSESCILVDGQPVCDVCLMGDPDPPLDPGLDPLTADLDCSATGGGGTGGAGGGSGCDWDDFPPPDWDDSAWCGDGGSGGAGAGGFNPVGSGGGNTGGASTGGWNPWDPTTVGAGGYGSSGSGAGAWNPWDPTTVGAGGYGSSGSGAGAWDPGTAGVGGEPQYSAQANGAVCVQKTWADHWGEWCDIRKPAVQAWCNGDGDGPPQNIKNVIGGDYSWACCQFSWSGNTWTRLPGFRQSNGNCTDINQARCETVPKPGWATDMTDAQWASMGVVGTFFAACMAQMRGWKSTKGWSDHGSRMAVEVGCRTFSRTGCKGVDAMIKSLSAAPNPTNFQKRNLEMLLALYAALCTNSN